MAKEVIGESAAEAELLMAIAGGDQIALQKLWQLWANKVQLFVRYCLAPSGPEAAALAQEVTADVFHEVWCHPLRYDGRVAFGAWLLGIARQRSIDVLRQRQRRLEHEQAWDESQVGDIADDALAPDEQLSQNQERKAVMQCLKRLRNPLQREAMILWALEDMPLLQISQMQQCPENTVKTRLFHGRKNLRECVERFLKWAMPEHV